LIKEAIDKILSMAFDTIEKVDDRNYSTRPIHEVMDPMAKPIELRSLDGLIWWLVNEGGKVGAKFVNVYWTGQVTVMGEVGGQWKQREIFARVEMFPFSGFPFGQYLDQEDSIIKLQSLFVRTPELAHLIKEISRVRGSEEIVLEDDGMTQVVTQKDGAGRLSDKAMDPIISLQPYRTFREVTQPASDFLIRIRKGQNGPEVALFEADGGQWKDEAVRNIKAHICHELNKHERSVLRDIPDDAPRQHIYKFTVL